MSTIANIKTLHTAFDRRGRLKSGTRNGQMREAIALGKKQYGFSVDRRGRCYIPMVKPIPKGFHFEKGQLVRN